ncbi:MAG: hypothetical protein HRU20_23795 [Pseudomonadales bacterium]|nr:hypothetical protein [Pseudomonadales bacterium]
MPPFNAHLQHIEKLCDAGNSEALQTWSMQCAKAEISQSSLAFVYIEEYLSRQRNQIPSTFECIDALRPMHCMITEKLHGLIHNDESVNSAHNKVICNTVLALIKSESAAYQTVLKQSLQYKSDDEALAIYLHRAMATQLNALLHRQKLKLPIPMHYWKNFHQYFSLANQRHLISFRFCDGALAWDQRLSIGNLYAMALLLACARCNKLSSNKITILLEILCEYIDLVELSISPAKDTHEIAVDISSNRPPSFKSLLNFSRDAVLVYLHIDELIIKLKRQAQKKNSFSAPIYLHLADAWGECASREKREHVQQSIQINLGFEDIHYFLSGHQGLHELVGEKANLAIEYEDGENIELLEGLRSQNIYNSSLIQSKGHAITDEIPNWVHLKHDYPTEDNVKLKNCYQAILIDKSHSGCRIEWQGDEIPALELGAMLGLLTDPSSNNWVIGEIMWLHHKDQQAVETGVRIICQHPIPVAVDVPLKACLHVNFLPAIILPPSKSRRLKARLLVGKHGYEKGDEVKITQGEEEIALKLTRQLKQYQHINLFECGFFNLCDTSGQTKH